MSRPAANLVGQRFGRLIVIERAPQLSVGNVRWRCLCDCGGETVTQAGSLISGRTLSCGCVKAELALIANTTHGKSQSATYRSWAKMKARCTNPKAKEFVNYGGRGIQLCDRWYEFENFLADMGERPEGKTLDRIDNEGNYEPSNCRWATWAQQSMNKRNTRNFTLDGETLHLNEWAARWGLPRATLIHRLERGWSFERALKTPPDIRKRPKARK